MKAGKIKLSGDDRTHVRIVRKTADLFFASCVVQCEVPS